MSRIGWILAFVKLARIPGKNKKGNGITKCIQTTRKAARAPGKSSEIMTKFRIMGFNGISLRLVV